MRSCSILYRIVSPATLRGKRHQQNMLLLQYPLSDRIPRNNKGSPSRDGWQWLAVSSIGSYPPQPSYTGVANGGQIALQYPLSDRIPRNSTAPNAMSPSQIHLQYPLSDRIPRNY